MHCVEQEKDREKLRFSPSVTVVQQKKIDFPGFKLKTEKVLEAEAYVYTFVPNIRPIRAFTYTISIRCEKPIIQYPFFQKTSGNVSGDKLGSANKCNNVRQKSFAKTDEKKPASPFSPQYIY